MTIYVVVTPGMALAAYKNPTHAVAHARTITGAEVFDCELLTTLPASVSDDADSDSWDETETPIEIPPLVAARLKTRP